MPGEEAGILRVDHMVGNVELGKMNEWADWYSRVLGFKRYISFDDKDISTEYSALMSIVMSDDSYAIKFPLNEPAAGKRKSQIQEYLDYYGGPGVQHIALLTTDIARTVGALRENGVEFLNVPDSYYDALPQRVGEIDEAIETISGARHPGRSRRGRLPAAALHQAGARTGRRCSSRSSSGRGAAASARATSRRCSRRSSASRRERGNL